MAEPSRCAECGAELTGDSRSGELCAACLMTLALPEVVDREAGREAEDEDDPDMTRCRQDRGAL